MHTTIHVDHLSKHFRIYKKEAGLMGTLRSFFSRDYTVSKAVHNISFSIGQGELVGFIGPNGAGKTTTLKCLAGLIYPSEGNVSVLGYVPFERKHEYLKQISLVMGQKNQLWWDLPAMDSFLLYKEIYDIPDQEFKKTVGDLSDLMGLHDILTVQVRKLSLGQRMKLELAAQLLHKPKILFLDEPTIGLDLVVQQKMRTFIKEYNEQYKSTILLTSHYMNDVKELCKRVIIINHGKLLYDGTLSEIITKHTQLKRITVVFERPIEQIELSRIAPVVSYEDERVVFEVEKEKTASLTNHLLSQFQVADLTIEEPQIEEIIGTIFKNESV
jgi:ABC-2 type transport system ATP-binding protein